MQRPVEWANDFQPTGDLLNTVTFAGVQVDIYKADGVPEDGNPLYVLQPGESFSSATDLLYVPGSTLEIMLRIVPTVEIPLS